MFRLWGKEFKDNRMLRDTVICDDSDDTRTHKIFNALDAILAIFSESINCLLSTRFDCMLLRYQDEAVCHVIPNH